MNSLHLHNYSMKYIYPKFIVKKIFSTEKLSDLLKVTKVVGNKLWLVVRPRMAEE